MGSMVVAKAEVLPTVSARQARPPLPLLLIPPVLLTAVLWKSGTVPVSSTQATLGLILTYIPWLSYWQWERSTPGRFPLFTAVSFVYWLYYAVPLFWGDRFAPIIGHVAFVSDTSATGAMVMAVAGVSAMWAGYSLGFGRRQRVPSFVDLDPGKRSRVYVRAVMMVTTLLVLAIESGQQAPSGVRQIILTVQVSIPLFAYVILLRDILRGRGGRIDYLLVALYLCVSLGVGLVQGQLGPSLTPALAYVAVYFWERRRLPLQIMVVGFLLVLFLQPTKNIIRRQFAIDGYAGTAASQSGSPLDRATSWVQTSSSAWMSAIEDPASGQALQLAQATVLRTSLLTQTAHVLDWTPSIVPYQNGSTYTYLVASLIPRFVWPDKPSFNDANQWYQIAYDLTSPDQLSTVSISAGSMTEGYINFGWIGVIAVMILLGVLFDFVSASFLSTSSGQFLSALGILMVLQFVVIESQLAVYLSGIVQTAALATLIFFPVLRWGVSDGQPA